MTAYNTDLLKKLTRKFVSQIGAAGVTDDTVTTIPLSSATNLATDTAVVATIDRVDANGLKTPTLEESVIGVVSGSNLVTCTRGAEGTAQSHAAGAVVEILVTAKGYNDIIDHLLVEHTQLGVHSSSLGVGYQSLSRNCIINSGFTVNQRKYVSDATLASGVYGHDRWKAGSGGGDYTFTQLAQSTAITIKAAKTLIQVIEDKNVIGGTYTLSWTGTAQARYAVDSATPAGAYAASPIAITGQTAGTVMSVEFNAGTLSNVVLNSGAVALSFMPKSYDEELRACQRYCRAYTSAGVNAIVGAGNGETTTNAYINVFFSMPMRGVPTLTATAADWKINDAVSAIDVTSIALLGSGYSNENGIMLACGVASGITAYRPYNLVADGNANRILILSAEL